MVNAVPIMKSMRLALLVAASLGLSACTGFAKSATADIKGTTDGSPVSGTLRLQETPEGLKVNASLKGVSPGLHGFHIHENGACTEEGKAAGGHFNPDQVDHGFLSHDGFSHAHAGDLGNMNIGADGTGELEVVLPGLNLTEGKYNVSGKAVILHEKEDDFGQPTGNAGGRIGCGVITDDSAAV